MKFLKSESIKCKSCGEILNQPVFLPCGHSICKRHETEDNQNIECIKCNKSFEIPADGFTPNRDLESLLEREINELDLGEEYNWYFHKFTQFEQLLEHFSRVIIDPETRINSVLSDLRNKVDLRREELKQEIDKEALKMIKKIDSFEKEFKSTSIKSGSDLERKLESWTNDLTVCKQSLNSFKRDTNKWKSAFDASTSTMKDVQTEYLKFNDGLFFNRLNDLKSKLSVSSYFKTISVEVKELSKLKDIKQCKQLISQKLNSSGTELTLNVQCVQSEEKQQANGTSNAIKANLYLYSDTGERINYKVDFDLVIVDQLEMGKSNVKSFTYKFPDDKNGYFNFAHLIKLKDLMEDYNLYNIEKDSCIVQAVVKRLEYF